MSKHIASRAYRRGRRPLPDPALTPTRTTPSTFSHGATSKQRCAGAFTTQGCSERGEPGTEGARGSAWHPPGTGMGPGTAGRQRQPHPQETALPHPSSSRSPCLADPALDPRPPPVCLQEYRRAAHALAGLTGPLPTFLRLYATYLAGEKRRE